MKKHEMVKKGISILLSVDTPVSEIMDLYGDHIAECSECSEALEKGIVDYKIIDEADETLLRNARLQLREKLYNIKFRKEQTSKTVSYKEKKSMPKEEKEEVGTDVFFSDYMGAEMKDLKWHKIGLGFIITGFFLAILSIVTLFGILFDEFYDFECLLPIFLVSALLIIAGNGLINYYRARVAEKNMDSYLEKELDTILGSK